MLSAGVKTLKFFEELMLIKLVHQLYGLCQQVNQGFHKAPKNK